MDEVIKNLAIKVAGRFSHSLSLFRPFLPGGELLEQNLITLFSHEFLLRFSEDKRCIAYSEIPFKEQNCSSLGNVEDEEVKSPSRIDGYLANSGAGYFIEAKCAGSKAALLKGISKDLGRIHSPGLKASFKDMCSFGDRSYEAPSIFSGIIIAGFWCQANIKPWFDSEVDFELQLANLQAEYPVQSVLRKVGQYGSDGNRWDFYIVVAQTKPFGLESH